MVVDLELIAAWVGAILAIGTPCVVVVKWILNIVERIKKLETEEEEDKVELEDSKTERMILLKGLLACLKGLKEQGCNGPVTVAIKDIEEYLIDKSH